MASPRLIGAASLALLLAGCGDPGSSANYLRAIDALNHGQFESARAAAEAGYCVWQSRPQAPEHWRFRLALAEALLELDRPRDAAKLLESPAPRADDDAQRLAGLARAHLRTRHPDLVAGDLAKARAAAPDAAGEVAARIDVVEAMADVRASQPEKADVLLRHTLKGVEGSRTLIESYVLNDLGVAAEHLFQYDQAKYWYERARELAVVNGMPRSTELAVANLGSAFLNLGDTERAIDDLEQGLQVAAKLNDSIYKMTILARLGEAWWAAGDLTKAADFLRQAQKLGNPQVEPKALADILDDLSRVDLRRRDVEAAAVLNRQGLELARPLRVKQTQRSLELGSGDIAMARRDYARAAKIYAQVLTDSAADKNPDAMFQSQAGLAAAYRAQNDAPKAEAAFRAGAELIDSAQSKLTLDESKFSYLSFLIDFYRNYVDFLMERGDPDGAFRVAESCRARVLEEKLARDGTRDLAGNVKALVASAGATDTTLLAYWLAPGRSLVWVIDGKGSNFYPLPGETEIAAQVQRFNDAVQRSENVAAGNAAGEWLFANLVEKWAPKGKVAIEPDGPLHRLNFEALPSGGGRYWIEDATVSIAPSLGVLRKSAPDRKRRLLAFGDPGYEGKEYTQLANLKDELESVAKHFHGARVYSGAEATPDAYRESHAERYSMLHFAAHAVANRESPLDSAIILAGTADKRKLYARDILSQPLKAELVTLSACQTAGSREYRGEGMTGFSWAFLSAGARNVVAGLWDVDDRATAKLMSGFYDQLSKGLPPAGALRRAKLAFLAGGGPYAKPLYWAAFETFTKALY